ncbi:glycosyltransferase family 4 protein [Pectobacterium colocasium]|uniref:glycosyltransferase family 4 protein n=1 Tax=Pectobacterium colocasium TaxID=2878098 RepID=UPI003B27F1ED
MNLSGGTEKMVSVIANKLSSSYDNVHVLSIFSGKEPFFSIDKCIKIENIYDDEISMTKNYFHISYGIRKYTRENNINVFIDVDTTLSLFSLFSLVGMNVKHISWEHFNYNVFRDVFKRKLARKLAALFSDYVVTLTEKDRELWLSNSRCKANVIAINNPIPFNISDYESNSYCQESKTVLAVGRFTEQKGFDLLIEAWSFLVNRAPGWRLHMVGSGEDEEKLKSLISHYGLSDTVALYPPTKDIELHYKSAAIYCMSSRYEGLPMVLLEAIYYKLPIISFDCDTGPSEVIDDDVTGMLCEPFDTYSLSNKLLELMNDDKKRVSFSMETSKIIHRFCIESIMEKWHFIIKN